MQIELDDGTLLLRDAPDTVPYAKWDDRIDEHRAQALFYRSIRDWDGVWEDTTDSDGQPELHQTPGQGVTIRDDARAYPELALTPAVQIEARDYR